MVVTETCCVRDPLQCIIPPYMLERLAESGYPGHPDQAELADLAEWARDSMLRSIETRAFREATRAAPQLLVSPSPDGGMHRMVYDAGGSFDLPGKLVRSEGDADTGDMAVREAYRHTGSVWNFFNKVHGRNSLDGLGMTLKSCVHVGRNYSNAFWDGSRMGFGDGDGILFRRFTRSIEVVAHELAHGVISFSGDLRYYGESGALNEHFGDVFGVLVHQWKRRQEARGGDWTIGSDLLVKASTRRALRDMAAPGTAYRDDPFLGDDPQPAHWDDRYRGDSDNGGVHINSGIPNHAFYRASVELGGNAWETLGDVWYQSLQLLKADSRFQDCAEITERETARQFGVRSREVNSVRRGWRAVGIVV